MKSSFLAILFLAFSTSVLSQHIRIDKNQLEALKNEKQVQVVFNYDNYKRGGDNISEAEYIKNRLTKLSEKGMDTAAWRAAYNHYKNTLWPEAFIMHLNESLERYQAPIFTMQSAPETNYRMEVYVPWMYSGYDVGIGRAPAKVRLKVTFVNLQTEKKKSPIHISDVTADNTKADNDSTWPNLSRVENAFYAAGFKLGIALKRLFDKRKK